MNWLIRLLFTLFRHHAKLRLISEAKKKGVVTYLRVVQGSRRALILALLGFFVLQFMVLAALGALVSGVLLLDYEWQTKIEILFWTFTGMFTLPALLMFFVFSERLWYKASGAERMVEDLRAGSKEAA